MRCFFVFKRDLTAAKGEQERLLLERFQHVTTINDLKDQLRYAKAGMNAQIKASPTTSEYGKEIRILKLALTER